MQQHGQAVGQAVFFCCVSGMMKPASRRWPSSPSSCIRHRAPSRSTPMRFLPDTLKRIAVGEGLSLVRQGRGF